MNMKPFHIKDNFSEKHSTKSKNTFAEVYKYQGFV